MNKLEIIDGKTFIDGIEYAPVNQENKVFDWWPRIGEIVRCADNPCFHDYGIGALNKIHANAEYPYEVCTGYWKYIAPLNMPNVIQMIPRQLYQCPCNPDNRVLVKHEDGTLMIDYSSKIIWGINSNNVTHYAVLN